MNEQTRKKALRWFIDLINTNLDTLPISDKIKLTVEAVSIIDGMAPWRFGDKNEILTPFSERLTDKIVIEKTLIDWRKNEKLKSCQIRLREFFAIYMKNVNVARESANDKKKSISELNNYFPLAEARMQDFSLRAEVLVIPWEDIMIEDDDVFMNLSEEAIMQSPVNLVFKAKTDEDTLLSYLLMALWFSPLGSIRTCEECDKYFVHTSKKKKIFCSSKCAMRKANRDRRTRMKENEPDKYKMELDKGKKRATKSYKQRMKKKLGTKVKVGKKS
jgi:hypothetical protein